MEYCIGEAYVKKEGIVQNARKELEPAYVKKEQNDHNSRKGLEPAYVKKEGIKN